MDNNHVNNSVGGGTPGSAERQLLPRPRWAPLSGSALAFDTTADLTSFLCRLQDLIHEELCSRRYNTLGNLLKFYSEYKKAAPMGLTEFFRGYRAPVVQDGLSCVGLSLHLSRNLRKRFPGAKPFLVSCEEWIPDVETYCSSDPPDASSIKEHVLVALRVWVREGRRAGLVLMDTGYHVGFPVTVMEDKLAPHTGHFVQSNTAKSVKEYCYEALGSRYVRWRVSETRAGAVKTWDNVLYVGGAFQSALACSEKRNLLYDFRTLVARDGGGPRAGVYCKLAEVNRNPVFTLFFNRGGARTEVKIPFYLFCNVAEPPEAEDVAECAQQVGMSTDELFGILRGVANLYEDVDFVSDLLDLNRRVDPFDG